MASRRRPRDVQTRFNKAVSVVQSLPKDGPFQPSNMMKLKFYAFYKQATVGPCNIARPGFWDVTGRAKWEAWNMAGNMPKEEAMLNYVEELQKIVETMPQSKEVEDFLRSIGPFYEEVDEEPTQPSTDAVKNEPTGPQEQDTTNNPGTVEAIIDGTKEKKEVGSSDSEEEIFSDPIATPESPSTALVYFATPPQPLMSPHHPLKTPLINSSSEGETSDEYVVVSDQTKTGMQTPVVNGNSKPEDSSVGDNTDYYKDHIMTQLQPLTDQTVDQNTVSLSAQLEQVRQDLQSILNRLNSLEVLLQRRRVIQSRWWLRLFANLSWPTLVIILLWPIVVNVLWRRMRKYSSKLCIR